MVIDYNYYKTEYGGSIIDDTNFLFYAKKAINYINCITFGKADRSNLDTVRDCVCAISDEYYKDDQINKHIKSENNDGYSITYNDSDLKTLIALIATTYLSNTGLLYRGK